MVRKGVQQKQTLFLATRRMKQRSLSRAWISIAQFATARKRLKTIIGTRLYLKAKALMRTGIAAFRDNSASALEAVRRNRRSNAILYRIDNRIVARAFSSWAQTTQVHKENRTRVSRALSKMRFRTLSGTFDVLVRNRDMRKAAYAVIVRRIRIRQRIAVQYGFAKIGDSAKAAKEAERKSKAAQTIFSRVMHRYLARSFTAWTSRARDAKVNRVRIARALARMRLRRLAICFEKIRESAVARREATERIVCKIHDHQDKCLRYGLINLRIHADKVKREEHKSRRMLQILTRIENRTITRALVAWRDEAKSRIRNRVSVQRAVGRMKKRLVASAFATWQEKIAKKVGLRSIITRLMAAKRRNALAGGMKVMLVYARSVEKAQEHDKRVRQVFAGCARRMQSRALSASFSSWYSFWRTKKENRAKIRRSLARLRHKKLAETFIHLRDYAVYQMDVKEVLHGCLESAKQRLIKNTFRRLQRYAGYVHEAREELSYNRLRARIVRRVAYKIQRKFLSKGWNAWTHHMLVQRNMSRIFAGGINRMRK